MAQAQTVPLIKKLDHVHASITKMKDPLDDTNWMIWREHIRRIFSICGIDHYVYSKLERPDLAIDPEITTTWDINDMYAQIIITNNISKDQMVHVTRLDTVHKIWKSLEAIHETRDYQIAIAIQCTLFRQCASDGDDITEHLTQLKRKWEQLNVLDDADFCISDIRFKTIIASSLPPSWDTFTEPYVGRRIGATENDPKKLTSSQEFIGILKEEYTKRKDRQGTTQQTYYSKPYGNNKQRQSLTDRIQGSANSSSGMLCRNCQHTNHVTDN